MREQKTGDSPVKQNESGPGGMKRVFADERTRILWELGEAVERIAVTLPPEGQRLNSSLVTFDKEHEQKGNYALFLSGTVIGTDKKGVFLVPERSLKILQEIGIPYKIVSPRPEAT